MNFNSYTTLFIYLLTLTNVLAAVFCVISFRKAASLVRSSRAVRDLSRLEIEIADLSDRLTATIRLVKRINGRENMRKHREKANGKKDMTDEEWRVYATKRAQQGLPIE